MNLKHFPLSALLLAASLQGAAPANPEADLRLRLSQTASRATANFRAADSIEDSLKARGMTLHPKWIALRLRIETALDESDAAINKGEERQANEALARASALIDSFALAIGGA